MGFNAFEWTDEQFASTEYMTFQHEVISANTEQKHNKGPFDVLPSPMCNFTELF